LVAYREGIVKLGGVGKVYWHIGYCKARYGISTAKIGSVRKPHYFEETEVPVDLKITTYCPTKWLLVDQETGQVFRGNKAGYWDRLEPVIKDK
jgi:hypothetical protein